MLEICYRMRLGLGLGLGFRFDWNASMEAIQNDSGLHLI
jgi:hypothetical protein